MPIDQKTLIKLGELLGHSNAEKFVESLLQVSEWSSSIPMDADVVAADDQIFESQKFIFDLVQEDKTKGIEAIRIAVQAHTGNEISKQDASDWIENLHSFLIMETHDRKHSKEDLERHNEDLAFLESLREKTPDTHALDDAINSTQKIIETHEKQENLRTSHQTKTTKLGLHDTLARKAMSEGKTAEQFHRAAQVKANNTWFWGLVSAGVWFFWGLGWAMIPAVLAVFNAFQSVSATKIEMRLEKMQ